VATETGMGGGAFVEALACAGVGFCRSTTTAVAMAVSAAAVGHQKRRRDRAGSWRGMAVPWKKLRNEGETAKKG
jgi:hypothetical protein